MDVSTARQAAQAALKFLSELQPEPAMTDFRIEEIELSDSGEDWSVTVSYLRRRPDDEPGFGGARGLLGIDRDRAYKRVGVRASDGSITGMRIRELSVG